MGKIINFEQFKNNMIEKKMDLETEILLIVIKSIYMHIQYKTEDILESMNPNSSLEELFYGDRTEFAKAFVEIFKTLNLKNIPKEEIPFDREFETFQTVNDLCVYFYNKLENNR